VTGRFGPQTAEIERFLGLIPGLKPGQFHELANAWETRRNSSLKYHSEPVVLAAIDDAGRGDEWDSVLDAVHAALWDAEDGIEIDWRVFGVARNALTDAAFALCAWDLDSELDSVPDIVESYIAAAEDVLGPLRPQGRTA
jgi:hypothetical protein